MIVILLGRLFNQGGAGGIIDKHQYLDQSKNLVTVNCLRFSQVMLPCPRKPNSLFNRISASMHVWCVYTCVIYITYPLAFFVIFFCLYSFLSCSYYSLLLIKFLHGKNQNFFYIGILSCVTKTHSIMISNIILIILLILILLYPRYYAFINRLCR